jgi:hypothetical protein
MAQVLCYLIHFNKKLYKLTYETQLAKEYSKNLINHNRIFHYPPRKYIQFSHINELRIEFFSTLSL